MIAWLARVLLVAGGVVTSWFVAKDAPVFTIVQGVAADADLGGICPGVLA
jgi:hypothetical protein